MLNKRNAYFILVYNLLPNSPFLLYFHVYILVHLDITYSDKNKMGFNDTDRMSKASGGFRTQNRFVSSFVGNTKIKGLTFHAYIDRRRCSFLRFCIISR